MKMELFAFCGDSKSAVRPFSSFLNLSSAGFPPQSDEEFMHFFFFFSSLGDRRRRDVIRRLSFFFPFFDRSWTRMPLGFPSRFFFPLLVGWHRYLVFSG